MDISYSNVDGTIELENNDLKLTSDVSTVEGIRQDIQATLQTFQGEYFLDEGNNYGVPWITEVFQQKPMDYGLVAEIISRAILSVEGVASIDDLKIERVRQVNGANVRMIQVTFVATTKDGQVINDIAGV